MELVVQLGLGLVHLYYCGSATAAPSSECQRQCGDVQIPYPFGIGKNCSLTGDFDVTCQPDQHGVSSKPFIGDRELLDISLSSSAVRVLNPITAYCYNDTWHMNSANIQQINDSLSLISTVGNCPPFLFSSTRNKFTVIGCNTLGLIGSNNNVSDYMSGCVTTCGRNISDDTSCSGMGCCQTLIPSGMDSFGVALTVLKQLDLNTSQAQAADYTRTGFRCSYAVLMEAAAFSFSKMYINTTKFNDMGAGQAPAVLDWSIRNQTCEVAQMNYLTAGTTYACLSTNSVCLDSNSTIGSPGYVCNCSQGYEGNPYLPDGCKGYVPTNNSASIGYLYPIIPILSMSTTLHI